MRGLDLRKFKKVSADDDFTVMKHDAGHEIKVAHKKLSKEHRSQLEALPMASGGKVPGDKDKGPYIDLSAAKAIEAGMRGQKAAPTKDDSTPGVVSSTRTPSSPDPDKAQHDSIERQKAAFNSQMNRPVQNYADGGVTATFTQDSPDQIVADAASVEQPIATSPQADPNKYAGVYEDRMKFYQQNTPAKPVQSMTGDALAEAERIKNIDEYKATESQKAQGAEQARMLAENERKAALGIPVTSMPETAASAPPETMAPAAASAPVPAQSQVPAPPTAAVGEGQKLLSAFDKQTADQAKILQESARMQQKMLEQGQKTMQDVNAEYANFVHDIQNQHIDPDRLWNSKSEAGKAATILGIMLAGFSPANRPNAAIEELDKAIDRDVDSQKAELGKKQSLLATNMQHFKDINQAAEMTRIMQMSVVSEKMKAAAAKAGDPIVKAKILEDVANYDAKVTARVDALGQKKALADLYAAARDPKKTEAAIAALERVDPKAGADMRAKWVPGLGLANTDKDASDLKEMKSNLDSAKGGINQLLTMTHKAGKSFNLKDRAEAEVIQQSLVGLLRLPITGPGAMNEGERKMIERMIADPTAMFSLDSTNRAKLNSLSQQLDMKLGTAARARGIPVSSDNQYVEWAKANPNDPQAKVILKNAGRK